MRRKVLKKALVSLLTTAMLVTGTGCVSVFAGTLQDDSTAIEDTAGEMADSDAQSEPVTGTCGENLTWSFEDGVLTISGSGETASIDWEEASLWGDLADAIEVVVVEEGVTGLGKRIFAGCSNLTEITLPESLTSIGDGAFHMCGSLTRVKLLDGLTSIGYLAFGLCTGLTEITLPESVTGIGEFAFYRCTGLTSMRLPENVTSIGMYAFSCCEGLTSIEIPDSVTSIGEGVFGRCFKLLDIKLSDSHPMYIFEDRCLMDKDKKLLLFVENAADVVSFTVPEGITRIGDYAVSSCRNLTNVTVSDKVTSIGWGAFEECGFASISFKGNVPEGDSFRDFLSRSEGMTITYLDGIAGWNELQAAYPGINWINSSKKTGWINENNTWQYYDESGVMVTGWKMIGKKWYFFDKEGIMKTGWLQSGGKWYYMDANGAMKTGWVQSGGKWYYLDASGAMKTGWVQSGGKWYYMDVNGKMTTDWLQVGSKWYYFDGSGVMVVGEKTIGGKLYKFDANGVWVE